jgi:hypothetical protein
MKCRPVPQIVDSYKIEDALFSSALRQQVNHHPTPQIWRRVANRAVFHRMKQAFSGLRRLSPNELLLFKHHPSIDSVTVARRGI